MVTRHDGTTDLPGGNLGHIQDNDGGHESNTEPSNETAGDEKTESVGCGLEDDTDDEDDATKDNGGSATIKVGKITGNESTEESTRREDRGDQRFLRCGEGKIGGRGSSWIQACQKLDDVRHAHDTVDVSRIETEEDTTKSGKGTHEIGPGGDGGLDARRVGGGR